MSEIINSTYLTLDGVIEHPETWPDTGGFGPEGNKIQTDLVLGCSVDGRAVALAACRAGVAGQREGEGPQFVAGLVEQGFGVGPDLGNGPGGSTVRADRRTRLAVASPGCLHSFP